jgi:hypothetical protein
MLLLIVMLARLRTPSASGRDSRTTPGVGFLPDAAACSVFTEFYQAVSSGRKHVT